LLEEHARGELLWMSKLWLGDPPQDSVGFTKSTIKAATTPDADRLAGVLGKAAEAVVGHRHRANSRRDADEPRLASLRLGDWVMWRMLVPEPGLVFASTLPDLDAEVLRAVLSLAGRSPFSREALAELRLASPPASVVVFGKLPLEALPYFELFKAHHGGNQLTDEWRRYYEQMLAMLQRQHRMVHAAITFDATGLHQRIVY
jgi:hypothetical protein